MADNRDIKYIERDFSSFREQLIQFSKNYFPDTYNDFSPTSPGMMFIEMAAYVGDVLSFYQDTQLQETFVQYVKNPKNIYNMAYMLGYRPKTTSIAQTTVQISQLVAPDPLNINEPDWTQAAKIGRNTELRASSVGSPTFIIENEIDFNFSSSYDPTEISIYEIDNIGNPISYLLTKKTKAFSGEVRTIQRTFDSFSAFSTITIEDTDIVGILDIVDENENEWYEVPFLGQESIYTQTRNTNPDTKQVYNKLSLLKTSKRFVTRFDSKGFLNIQFGSGTKPEDDLQFVPTLENVGLGTNTGIKRLDYAYDPSNFLYTRTYGQAPIGTLTVRYIVGGGVQSNIPANVLTEVQSIDLIQGSLDTISFYNTEAATGGSDGDSLQEIRENAIRAFNEQSRVVTLQDYEVRTYSLPSNLGSIAKVYATNDQLSSPESTTDIIVDSNPLSISLYVLTYDNEGKLTQATSTLKENLKNYLHPYMILTDAVNIKDAYVVNIGVEYDIVTYPNNLGRDVLLRCNQALADYFNISNININQPINISELYTLLDRIKGVQTVQDVRIVNKVGGVYSNLGYDVQGAIRNNILYPSLDPCIFELKYSDTDIKGKITSL
jgi:hypothetical protein